jgi:hypothetical protein
MKRDLDRYQQDYAESPFEETMAEVRKRMLQEFLGRHRFVDILEVGCADKPLFASLNDFRSFLVVEPCQAFFEKAQASARIQMSPERIQFFNQTFEDFHGEVRIDCIIISSLLHEIGDPKGMIEHAFRIARPGCWLHVNVPNAKSFHRLWAKESGLIKTEYEKSATQIRLQQGHTFDLESLTRLVEGAGFSIVESGSYLIKPFTHAQMQQLADLGILTEDLIAGLMRMEKHAPGLGAEIFVNACKPATPLRKDT